MHIKIILQTGSYIKGEVKLFLTSRFFTLKQRFIWLELEGWEEGHVTHKLLTSFDIATNYAYEKNKVQVKKIRSEGHSSLAL